MNSVRRRPAHDNTPPPRRRRGVRPSNRILLKEFVQSGRVISLGLVVVVLYYVVQMLWSGTYVVQNVLVEGAATMSRQRVSDIANVHGQSIWSVNPDTIRARLLKNPYVTSASVQVALPDTVKITITEQKSEIRWKSGAWYLIVNGEGELLGIDTAVVLSDTIVINDDSGKKLKAGDKVDSNVIALARDISLRTPADAGVVIARLGWDPRRGVHVRTSSGEVILFGNGDRLDEKIAILRQLRASKAEFAFADLRPMTPYYRADIPLTEVVSETQLMSETLPISVTATVAITATDNLTITATPLP